MHSIPYSDAFTLIESIEKGWSGEKKYYVETTRGERLLLRVTDASELGRKQLEFALMEQAWSLGVPMSRPLNVGREVYIPFLPGVMVKTLKWCFLL